MAIMALSVLVVFLSWLLYTGLTMEDYHTKTTYHDDDEEGI